MKRFALSLVVCTAAFVAMGQTRSGAVWRKTIHLESLANMTGTGITSPELLAHEPQASRLYVAPAFGNEIHVLNSYTLEFNSVIRGVWSDQFKSLAVDPPTGRIYASSGYGVTVFDDGIRTAHVTFGVAARPTQPVIGVNNVYVRAGDAIRVISKGGDVPVFETSDILVAETPLAFHPTLGVFVTNTTPPTGTGLGLIDDAAPGAPVPLAASAGHVPANVSGAVLFADNNRLAVLGGHTLQVFNTGDGSPVFADPIDLSAVGTNIRIAGSFSGELFAAGSNGLFSVDPGGNVTAVSDGQPVGDVIPYYVGDGITEYFYTLPRANTVRRESYAAQPVVGASDFAINTSSNTIYLAENRTAGTPRVSSFEGNTGDQFLTGFETVCATISAAVRMASTPLTIYGGCTDNTIRWFQGTSNATISVPNGALDLAVNETLGRLYAVGPLGLSVINGTILGAQPSLPGAANVAVNTLTNNVYVTVPGTPAGTSTLAIFDAAGAPVTTRTAAGRFAGITVHPDGRIFVVARLAAGSAIYVYDSTTHDLTGTINLPAIVDPVGIAIDSATNTAYIPDAAPLSLIPAGESGWGVAYQMFVVDLTAGDVVHSIRLGGLPSAVALNPVTGRVYVASATSDSFNVYQIVTANPGALVFDSIGGAPPADQASDISADREPESPLLAASSIVWGLPSITEPEYTTFTLPIGVDPTDLAAGSYTGSVFLTDPELYLAGLPIALTLNVSGDLTVTPVSMAFSGSGTQTLSISRPFGSLVSATADVPWLTVTGGGTVPQDFQVTASGAGLTGGIHNGSISVTAPTAPAPVSVPVTLTVAGPGFTVYQSALGDFTQGQLGARYQIDIFSSGTVATVGAVTVTDTVPAGLTPTAMYGTGWTCTLASRSCTRSDAVGPGSPYDPIYVVVDVASTAAASVVNQVTVSGGGSVDVTSNQTTTILARPAYMLVKITPAQGQSGDFFGRSVELDASRLFVGAPGDSGNSGAVYVYSAATGWAQETKLAPAIEGSRLGSSVRALPDALLAAADRTPGVYVIARPGWTPGPTLTVPGGDVDTELGRPIAVSGDTLIAGAPLENAESGSAYVFVRDASGAWTQQAALLPGDPFQGHYFGTSVAISGDTAVVGAPGADNTAGAAYVFVRSGGVWTEQAKLYVPGPPSPPLAALRRQAVSRPKSLFANGMPGSALGWSVALEGDTAIVGENNAVGGAHVFTRAGTVWTHQTTLTVPEPSYAGYSVALAGDLAAVGAPGEDNGNGTVHVFSGAGASWTELAVLQPPEAGHVYESGDRFGSFVAVNGYRIAVSQQYEGGAGAAYVYQLGAPDLTIASTHTGDFYQGQTGATYSIVAGNSGSAPTSGTVIVTDTVPAGMTATALSGTGWSCQLSSLTCTRSDALAAGASYPAITLTVNVAASAASGVNVATVSGGGDGNPANNSVQDNTTVAGGLTLACPADTAQRGVNYSSVLTATGGSGTYAWSVISGALPDGLSIQGATLSGTPGVAELANFTLQVLSSGQVAQRSCSIRVGGGLALSCPASTATLGTFYSSSATADSATDVRWSMLGGSLPPGLTLSGGTVSGTPAGPPGTAAFSLRGRSDSGTDDIECSITVEAPVLQVTSGCPGGAIVGVPFAPFALTATGGLGPGTYSFTNADGMLPPGLYISGGEIRGTPTNPGVFIFAIQAMSGTQVAKSARCSIPVSASPLKVEGGCPGTVQSGAAVSIPLTASGGLPPYRWSLEGPSWLGMQGGTVSGTAPMGAGDYAFTVTINDGANSPATRFSCSIKVAPPPLKVNGACPAAVAARTSVSAQYTVEGGVAPYRTSLSGPSWLSLAANGAAGTVSGTPSEAGSHRFTVSVTDSANTAASYSCDIVATSPPLTLAGACPTGIVRPGSISMPLSGSGGMAPYSWGVSGPSWLSVTGSGAQATLSGTPPSAGAVNFTVTLSDGVKTPPASLVCSVAVAPPALPAVTLFVEQLRRPLPEPQPVFLQFAGPAPVALAGSLAVTFVPNAAGATDSPEVQFVDGGGVGVGRTLTIQVPAGATSAGPFPVRQGTIAGAIRVELRSLTDGGAELLSGRPSIEIVIARQEPVVTSMVLENERPDGFDVVISGYSTPREIGSVRLNFVAKPEARIDGATSATVDVSQLFANFYARPASLAGGSVFTGLRIPVNVGGSKAAIGAVEATLVNSVGSSQPARISR